jgi:Tfp pilus assembly protein PilN
VPELNLLPEQYRRRARLTLRSSLLLIVLLELLLAAYIYQAQQELTTYGLQQLRARLAGRPDATVQRVASLQETLAKLEKERTQIEKGLQEIKTLTKDWGTLLNTFLTSAPQGTRITLLRQLTNSVSLTGVAPSVSLVNSYREALLKAEGIAAVVVRTLSQDPRTGEAQFTLDVALK